MASVYPWQQAFAERLFGQWRAQTFPSALLLVGEAGLGQAEFSERIAQYTFCERPLVNNPCGVCRSCRWCLDRSHPDYYYLSRDEKSRVIKVDAVRSLIEALQQTPQRASHQFVIIEDVDALHRSAGNALLKTLEEPPGAVFFILMTHQLGCVLPTIRSRCQQLNMTWQRDSASLHWLNSRLSGEVDAPLFLRLVGYPPPLKTCALAETDFLMYRDRVLRDFVALLSGRADPVAIAGYYVKENLDLISYAWFLMLADVQRLFAGAAEETITQIDRINELHQVMSLLTRTRFLTLLQRFFDLERLRHGPATMNSNLLFEDYLIQCVPVS